MPIDEKLKKQLRGYIVTQNKKGFTYQQIQKFLVSRGYSKVTVIEIINEIKTAPPKKAVWRYAAASLVLVLFVVLLIILIPYLVGAKVCDTNQCFIEAANECKHVMLSYDDAGTVYEYSSNNCKFAKAITKVSEAEPQSIKDLFSNKEMECSYEKGNFDEKWLTTLLGGLDQCSGSLKEALYELTIAQYQVDLENA